MTDVTVLGHDDTGVIAECDGFRYYLTPCCGASAKGCDGYIGCRGCYREIDPSLGGTPDHGTVLVKDKPEGASIRDDVLDGWWVFAERPIRFVEVYGDGLPWADWAQRVGIKVSAR